MKEELSEDELLEKVTTTEYKYGFITEIETDKIEKGLSEDVVRLISKKKNEPEWMLEYRLNAFKTWQKWKSLTGQILIILSQITKI